MDQAPTYIVNTLLGNMLSMLDFSSIGATQSISDFSCLIAEETPVPSVKTDLLLIFNDVSD